MQASGKLPGAAKPVPCKSVASRKYPREYASHPRCFVRPWRL